MGVNSHRSPVFNRALRCLGRSFPKLTLILAVIWLFPSSPGWAAGRKVVVVVANRVLLSDLNNNSVSSMLADGSAGLLSPNCVGPKTERSVILTAAAGAACRGGEYVAECFDAREITNGREMASGAYFSRTGRNVDKDSAVFLGVAQASRENFRSGRSLRTGGLADALHAAGKRTCAIDNADMPPDVIDRSPAVLAADSAGRIDHGLLSTARREGERHRLYDPYPASLIAQKAVEALRRDDLVVINFGETTRLDETRISISDQAMAGHWADALKNLDLLLRELIAYAETHNLTVVLVSFSPPTGGPWQDLTPIVFYPSLGQGVLTSPSTRTPGLVAASDFGPTILKIMGIASPTGMTGRAAETIDRGCNIAVLDNLDQRTKAKRVLEYRVLWTIAVIGIVACTLSAVVVGFGILSRVNKLLRVGLLIGVASPLAMLVASLAPSGVTGHVLAASLATVCAVAVAWGVGERAHKRSVVEGSPRPLALPVVVIYWATALCILFDSALGGNLCRFAIPSSYQISGFRYYGIGNEFAGALVSMTALALLFCGRSFRERFVIPVGLLTVASLGVGSLGANYGATIAAVVTFGLLWTAIRGGSIRARSVVLWCVLGAALSVSFAVAEWKLAGMHGTHAGQAGIGDGSFWNDVIGRKFLMNLKLTLSNTAEKAFLGFLPFIVLWFWRIHGKVITLFADDRPSVLGLFAVIIGAGVAYIVNDSGIVMSSIMVAMTVAILLYSLLEAGARS